MRLNLKSYNIADANDYLIRHIFKHQPHLTPAQMTAELGISPQYLKKKMEELKLHPKKRRVDSKEKERFFKRFHNAPWNRNIYFRKSAIETVHKYLRLWVKKQGYKNYQYLIFPDPDQVEGRVIVYLPKPR